MSKTILIKLTKASNKTGPFTIKDQFGHIIKTDVSKESLISGVAYSVDNDGDYCPENCKWASNDEQANCKTTNVFLEYNGETLTMAQWAKKLGYDYKWFHAQLKYKNITLEELINGRI